MIDRVRYLHGLCASTFNLVQKDRWPHTITAVGGRFSERSEVGVGCRAADQRRCLDCL